MKHTMYRYMVFLTLLHHMHLSSISLVYNFRIAQITKQAIVEESEKNKTLIALFFDLYQKKYNKISQSFVGGLGSFIYDFEPYYFRTDLAVSHIHAKDALHITTFNGTEIDDILFTLGRNFIPTEHTRATLSGLFGIPTHNIVALRHVGVGFSQVGIGLQADGSYSFKHDNSLIYGARYIYFIPRIACDDIRTRYKFTVGNIIDLLISYKKNFNKKHGVELGYTIRPEFGAHICPNLDDIVRKTNYIRSNLYFVYKYKFLMKDTHNRLLFNISYGRDHKSKIYGNKYIITFWASWNINF